MKSGLLVIKVELNKSLSTLLVMQLSLLTKGLYSSLLKQPKTPAQTGINYK